MKEEKAVAILMADFKGSKSKPTDLITFAEACRLLLNHNKWGIKEMSEYFGTSEYMIRQIDKINELDDKLKNLVRKYCLGIESAYHLWRIQKNEYRGLKDALESAEIIKNMKSDEVRTFMHFVTKNPDLSIEQCKGLAGKLHPNKIKILALPLDEPTYEKLQHNAKKSNMKLHEFILKKIIGVKING